MAYSLPYEVYVLLEDAFNHDRARAEQFAHAVEESLRQIEIEAEARLSAKQEAAKAQVYNELRNELATKEFVRAENNELRVEINELRAELKQQALLLKALIAIAVFGLTLFNPSFVRLVEVLTK